MEPMPLWKALIIYPLMWVVAGFWYVLMGGLMVILWPFTKLFPLPVAARR